MKKRTLIAILGVMFIASAAYVGRKQYFDKPYYVVKPDWAQTLEPVELKDPNRHNASIAGAMEYLNSRRADLKTGVVDMRDVYAVEAQIANRPRSKKGSWIQWDELGPDDVGGRTRAIVVDKDDHNRVYAGGVSGGFWISENGGATWKRGGGDNTTANNNMNIVSMIQTPDGTIYYGTGEGGYISTANGDGGSGFIGRGVYKSTDKGVTFTQLDATDPATQGAEWNNVHKLVSDPNNSNRVFAGNDRGIYVSEDGGATWARADASIPNRYCTDLVISPDGKTIFAALMSSRFSSFTLWRSTDGGKSFSQVGNTGDVILPVSSSSYRVAISQSNPNIIYLSTCKAAPDYSYDKMFRSDDNGDTWNMIVEGDGTYFNPVARQGYYDHCVVVDPKNSDRVFVAGLNIWEGKKINTQWQWKQVSSTSEFLDASNLYRNQYYVHADQHIMLFDNQENPAMYVGSDGGVSKSADVTYSTSPTFYNADFGYNTVQFYAIGMSAYDRKEVVGGTQDNGTILVNKGGVTLRNSTDIRGGDGGFSEISKINPNIYFSEYIQGDIRRSFNKGKGNSWSSFFDANIPPPGNTYPFITTYTLWESFYDSTSVDSVIFRDEKFGYKAGDTVKVASKNGGYLFDYVLQQDLAKATDLDVQDVVQSKLIIGSYNGIWMTKEALVASKTPEFFKISSVSMEVHAIKVTPDGNTVFVAGQQGTAGVVYRITGLSGKEFKYPFDPAGIGIKTVKLFNAVGQDATGIALNENDPNHLVVTLGSYGYKDHVFETKNALEPSTTPSFTNITGDLPSFPVYDAFINPQKPNQYLIATEMGVWASQDGGATWVEENTGMDRVPTFMLRSMNYGDKPWIGPVVFAGTHGRGIFVTSTIETGIRPSKKDETIKVDMTLYPNPVITYSNIKVNLEKSSAVQLTVFDLQGKVVYNMNYPNQVAGDHIYKIDASTYKPGTYFVKVKTAAGERTSKMLKME